MGKIQKMVWPQGKNLKPQPKGRAPVQAIPSSTRPKSAQERRRKEEYRPALAKGFYSRDPATAWQGTSSPIPVTVKNKAIGLTPLARYLRDWMLAYTWNCGVAWTAEQTARAESFLRELFSAEQQPMILAMDLDGELIPPLTVHPSPEVLETTEVLEYMEKVNRQIREMMTMPAALMTSSLPKRT